MASRASYWASARVLVLRPARRSRCRRQILCGNDTVTKLSPFTHEARRRSDGRLDGVTVVWHRVDAIDAKLKLRNSKKMTLSQHEQHPETY